MLNKIKKLKNFELKVGPVGSVSYILVSLKKKRVALISLAFIILLVLVAIFADLIAPFDMRAQDLSNTLTPPNLVHLMGTDELGRDVFSRIIFGVRTSLLIGLLAVLVALVVGAILGVLSGYYGKKVDSVIMRTIDILLAIPSILLAIAIVASLGSGIINLVIAIALANIPFFARIIRSAVIKVKEKEFILASKAIGASNFTIIKKHIIPNIMPIIIVQATLALASAILATAGLGFIGLGIDSAVAEWGMMLSLGQTYIRTHPYLTYFPGLAIMLTILAFNVLGDAIMDILDPKSQER